MEKNQYYCKTHSQEVLHRVAILPKSPISQYCMFCLFDLQNDQFSDYQNKINSLLLNTEFMPQIQSDLSSEIGNTQDSPSNSSKQHLTDDYSMLDFVTKIDSWNEYIQELNSKLVNLQEKIQNYFKYLQESLSHQLQKQEDDILVKLNFQKNSLNQLLIQLQNPIKLQLQNKPDDIDEKLKLAIQDLIKQDNLSDFDISIKRIVKMIQDRERIIGPGTTGNIEQIQNSLQQQINEDLKLVQTNLTLISEEDFNESITEKIKHSISEDLKNLNQISPETFFSVKSSFESALLTKEEMFQLKKVLKLKNPIFGVRSHFIDGYDMTDSLINYLDNQPSLILFRTSLNEKIAILNEKSGSVTINRIDDSYSFSGVKSVNKMGIIQVTDFLEINSDNVLTQNNYHTFDVSLKEFVITALELYKF